MPDRALKAPAILASARNTLSCRWLFGWSKINGHQSLPSNLAMGGAKLAYADRFSYVRDLWRDAPQDELKTLLLEHFADLRVEIHECFPMANKIVELCLIGRRHPRL